MNINSIKMHNYKITLNYFRILIFASFLPGANLILPFIPAKIAGFALSGYSWLLMLITSLFYLIAFKRKITFPVHIWLGWYILISLYLLISFTAVGLQGTIQFFVSFLVGLVTSSFVYNKYIISKILNYFKYLIIIVFLYNTIISYLKVGIWGWGNATDAHLVAIAGIILIALYYHYKKIKYLIYYVIITVVPILAVTRMGIFVMLLIPLIHFYKLINFKKLIILILLIPASIYIFNLPAIQEKMFFSDGGTISDLNYNSDNLNTSGRKPINDIMIKEFYKQPFWGHGARADYFFLMENGYKIKEAHNDYLQILVNYGIFGSIFIYLSFIFQFLAIKRLKVYTTFDRLIRSTFYTMQIILLFFMFSDTIIRLSYDYMNYYFAAIGVIYATHNRNLIIRDYANIRSHSPVQQKR